MSSESLPCDYWIIENNKDRNPRPIKSTWGEFVEMLRDMSASNARMDKDGPAIIPGYADRGAGELLRTQFSATVSRRYAEALIARLRSMVAYAQSAADADEGDDEDEDEAMDIMADEVEGLSADILGGVIQAHFSNPAQRKAGAKAASLAQLADKITQTVSDYPEITATIFREALCDIDAKFVGYRNDDNIDHISLVVLDIDVPGGAEQAEAVLGEMGCEWVKTSTHSYGRTKNYKFRLFVPLDEPIPAHRWSVAFDSLKAAIGKMDPACRNLSRIYYLPSHPPRGRNPSGDLAPVFKHHPGKPISLEQILNLGKCHGIDGPASQPAAINASAPVSEPVLHYCGALVDPFDMLERNAGYYTLGGYRKRHAGALRDLHREDSRHGFALSVTYREVRDAAARGRDIDPHTLVRFLVWACSQGGRTGERFSSRPITSGNTLDELAQMIDTAYMKNGLGLRADLMASIQGAIAAGREHESADGDYAAPEHPWHRWVTDTPLSIVANDGTYEDFSRRHGALIAQLGRSDIDARQFLVSALLGICAAEYLRSRPAFDAPAVAEFVYQKTMEFYVRKHRRFHQRLLGTQGGELGDPIASLARKMHLSLVTKRAGQGAIPIKRLVCQPAFGRQGATLDLETRLARASEMCVEKCRLDVWPSMGAHSLHERIRSMPLMSHTAGTGIAKNRCSAVPELP